MSTLAALAASVSSYSSRTTGVPGALEIFSDFSIAATAWPISFSWPAGVARSKVAPEPGNRRPMPSFWITLSFSWALLKISTSAWITWSGSGVTPRPASPTRGS